MNDAGSNVDDAGSKTRRRLCATIYLPANQPSRAFSNTNTQSVWQPTNHLSLSHSHVETHPRYLDTVGESSEREIETAAVVKHLLLCEREIGSDFDFS